MDHMDASPGKQREKLNQGLDGSQSREWIGVEYYSTRFFKYYSTLTFVDFDHTRDWITGEDGSHERMDCC